MRKKNISKLSEQDVAEEIIEEAEDELEREKGKKAKPGSNDTRNAIVFIVALLLVIGMAVFLYFQFFAPRTPAYDEIYAFNGFVFERSGALWKTEVKIGERLVTIPMHYGPKDVKGINITGTLNNSFGKGPIYISFDPTTGSEKGSIALAAGELSLNIVQGIGKSDLLAACSKNETAECSNRPIVDCSHKDKSVIFFAESDESYVTMDGMCVTIYGRGEGIVKATDRLLLFWYGIMDREGK